MKGERLLQYLTENNIEYDLIKHPTTYSSQMTAHAAHVPGKDLAKTVILKVDGKMVMVVTTANQSVNLGKVRKIYSTDDVQLAAERDFMGIFYDCELGAMPPFGNLYGMDELVSEELAGDDEIVFNAGTHTELIKMKYSEFEKLVHPKVVNLKYK